MPWVRLDDHFDENPKIVSVGPLGLALWVTGLAYCNRNLTDGFIPTSIAVRMLSLEWEQYGDACTVLVGGERSEDKEQIGSVPDRFYVVNMLVHAGLWDRVPGGYAIHDYTDFQPTKAEVDAERAARQAAGRAGGQASAQARAQAKVNGSASETPTDSQAKFKPVPVPVPVPVPDPEPGNAAAAAREQNDSPDALSEKDEAVGRLCREWERATGTTVTAMLGDRLAARLERMPEDWVRDGIREMGAAGAKAPRYLEAILDRWEAEGREQSPPVIDATEKFKSDRVLAGVKAWQEGHKQ